jgi:hypothetical protein
MHIFACHFNFSLKLPVVVTIGGSIMFKNRSKVMFVSAVLGSLYMVYIISYFFGGINSTEGAEQVGTALATAMVMPHMALLVLAVIFNWVGFFMNKKWAAITCGVLYAVSGVLFLLYIMFEIPMIILSFVGVSRINKINENNMHTEQGIA